MSMATRIGIYAPYTADESTRLGLDLVRYFTRSAYLTSWLTWQRHKESLDPAWDHLVRSEDSDQTFANWAKTLTHLIWFDVAANKLKLAKRAGVKNVLVPFWHRLNREDLPHLSLFHRIACPSLATYRWLHDYTSGLDLRCAPWDCGLKVNRLLRPDRPPRLCAWLDGATSRNIGMPICQTLRMLLDAQPDLDLTLIYSGGWSKPSLLGLQDLLQTHPARTQVLRQPAQSHRLFILRNSDWLFCPGVHENVGHIALEAVACGCPLLAFDIPPLSEIVKNRQNGVLIPCELTFNALRVPIPVMSTKTVFDTLAAAVADRKLLARIRENDWKIEERRTQFDTAWMCLMAAPHE